MAMQTPPKVITTKDLLYLKDQMAWELNAMKKCHHYAQECMDPDLRQLFDRIGRMHQRHYQMLLKHCQHSNASAMSRIAPQMAQQAQQQQQGTRMQP